MAYKKLTKRHRYEVLTSNKNERWTGVILRWKITYDGAPMSFHRTKAEAVRKAAYVARYYWQEEGVLSSLLIKRMDGTIQDERTYGKDPRETKG